MKLNPMAFANASALLVAMIYAVCAGLVALAPDFVISVANSWVHALDLSKIRDVNITAASLTFGLVSVTIFAWIADYLFAVIYNSLLKGREQ